MAKRTTSKVKGCRKGNRSRIKAEGRTKALSAFVRNKISAEEYFKLTNQSLKRG